MERVNVFMGTSSQQEANGVCLYGEKNPLCITEWISSMALKTNKGPVNQEQ